MKIGPEQLRAARTASRQRKREATSQLSQRQIDQINYDTKIENYIKSMFLYNTLYIEYNTLQ